MMYLVPYRPEHILNLRLQPAQADAAADVLWLAPFLAGPHSSTLMVDGRPMMCAGAVPLSRERALLWSFIGEDLRAPLFRQMHTIARQFIAALPYRRLEATAKVGFDAGHRWLRALGFEQFDCGAEDALYALVREA